MTKKRISLVEDNRTAEEKLEQLIPHYQLNKSKMDSYKKIVDKDNKEIKEIMLSISIIRIYSWGYQSNRSVSVREDFIEEALIEKLKEMKVDGVIKMKEYVDMDFLENAIYEWRIECSRVSFLPN